MFWSSEKNSEILSDSALYIESVNKFIFIIQKKGKKKEFFNENILINVMKISKVFWEKSNVHILIFKSRTDLEHTRPNHFSRTQWLDKPKLRNIRKRRDTSEMDVKDARAQFGDKMDQATGKKIFEGDSNPSIALAWTGDDGQTLLAVTTYESFVSFPRKILKQITIYLCNYWLIFYDFENIFKRPPQL